MGEFAAQTEPHVHEDAIDGDPIRISLNATARSIPKGAGWLTRQRELNDLFADGASHLLSLPTSDGEEIQWHAGAPGVGLSAGLERMAVEREQLRDCIAAFALDERIYAAEMRGGLRRQEAALFPNAFKEHVAKWRSEGRQFVHLTGRGRQKIALPNAWEIPVDMDVNALTFRHASLAMLLAGAIRKRDGFAALGGCAMAVLTMAGVAWWQSMSDPLETAQRLTELVMDPVEPSRPWGYADVAPFTSMLARRDRALWDASGASLLRFDPIQGDAVLLSSGGAVLAATRLTRTDVDERPFEPHALDDLAATTAELLNMPDAIATIDEAYSVGDGLMQRNATVRIGDFPEGDVRLQRGVDATGALLELTRRIDGLPITMHGAECEIEQGQVRICELEFSLRAPESMRRSNVEEEETT